MTPRQTPEEREPSRKPAELARLEVELAQCEVVFDLMIPQLGKYAFVDYDIRNVLLGSVGVLEVL